MLLDWVDSDMDGRPADGALVAAPLAEVAREIRRVVDDLRPTVVVTLDASDGHRDHARIRDATLMAVENGSWRPGRVYLHCLAQQLMRSWVEALRETDPGSQYLDLGELGTPEAEITTIIDTTELYDIREEAISLHRSQVSPYEVKPPDLRQAFLTAEYLIRIYPTWTGGPIETDILTTRD